MIISSILKIAIAASVANLKHLILQSTGSITPSYKLFLHFPLIKSNPTYFNSAFFGSSGFVYEAVWKTLNLAKSSVAS